MHLISVQVGLPREIEFAGRRFETAIFKTPTPNPVHVTAGGLDGDRQADLRVHGGPDKAVYAFSLDAYAGWPTTESAGAFGENLTIDHLDETRVCLGDRFTIGSSVLEVAQPRIPCFKLNARLADPHAATRFIDYRRPGAYFRVIQTGELRTGDALEPAYADPRRVSLLEAWDLIIHRRMSTEVVRRLLAIPSLNVKLREKAERLL